MNKCSLIGSAFLVLFYSSCQYHQYDAIHPMKQVIACDTSTYKGYDKDIVPIINKYCISCHNSKDALLKGDGVILDNYDEMWNNAGASFRDVSGTNYTMPKDAAKMDTCDIRTLKVWIDSGKNQ